eukprot:CAMPEP_0194354942 /NCGR_PEP_ID=MMETSP0174-20130528/2934_1 /TAXON_ID=216777 /ORGANISM="Proboscia alata, Strain PI-D3" /LENGTH=841 /DNA_ID=CAMNT_0039124021 /DNA_START=129 /DNA_END=2654 /DNA_ORIENTATION=-
MSLATSGGGGGMGGGGMSMATMAHGGPTGMQAHSHTQPPPSAATNATSISAPALNAALGADQLDKRIASHARSTASLPLVAVDIYGSGAVCYNRPMVDEEGKAMRYVSGAGGNDAKPIVSLKNSVGNSVYFRTEDEGAYKACRKLLSRGKGVGLVLKSHPINGDVKDGIEVVSVPHVTQLLGARRMSDLDANIAALYNASASTANGDGAGDAIAPTDTSTRPTLTQTSLDGGDPKNDDYDRIAVSLSLHSSKKPLTFLPEELVGLSYSKAKLWAHLSGGGTEEGEEVYGDYPVAIPLPGYANSDAGLESVIEAAGVNCNEGLVYNRGICALVGAQKISMNANSNGQPKPNKLLQCVGGELERLGKLAKLQEKPMEGEHTQALIMLVGYTAGIGMESYVVQLTPNTNQKGDGSPHTPAIAGYKTLASYCYRDANPLDNLEDAIEHLMETVQTLLPGRGVCAVLTYGTFTEQKAAALELLSILKATAGDQTGSLLDPNTKDSVNVTPPPIATREDAVAYGACVMASISHLRMPDIPPTSIATQPVLTSRVGIRTTYGPDIPPTYKIIFDYDRQLPAGPYKLECRASECAAAVAHGPEVVGDEDVVGKFMKKGNIPERDLAARALEVQMVQKTHRESEWVTVGNPIKPLCREDNSKADKSDAKDGDEEVAYVGCEASTLEISVNASGTITSCVYGDGESIVQATKTARNEKLQKYFWILFSILFFGGFFLKSYWEDRVQRLDTERLLKYYRLASKGTMADGDYHQARYVVYKYRNKKDKLWKKLERKYDLKVPELWEFPEGLMDDDPVVEEEKEDVEDLDAEEEKEEKTAQKPPVDDLDDEDEL